MSQPSYPSGIKQINDVTEKLRQATCHVSHHFLSDNISLTDINVVNWRYIQGHRQITDVYLLALAVQHQARFVSFDQRIDIHSVQGATPEHLVILK